MKNIVLHDYQKSLKADLYQEWITGQKNVLVRLDTGGGKSVIVSDVMLDGHRQGAKQAVIAHRNELVTQMSMHIANRGIPHRIIGSDSTIAQARRQHRAEFGDTLINPASSTWVVGVDTMVRRRELLEKDFRQIDRWAIDEAHHVIGGIELDANGQHVKNKNDEYVFNTLPNKWGTAVSMMPFALGAGFTATPLRADGKGLGRSFDGVFDSMVSGPDMRFLIQNGFLSDYEMVCPRSDLEVDDKDKSASGDWSNSTLRKAAKKSHIVGDTVENYCKYAYARRAIVFATDVETAGETASKFNSLGIPTVSLSAKTPTTVREKYIKEFRDGKIWVLINVDLFDEGFDVPACDVVVLARPTGSLGKYRQMVGRALRYVPGKIALIIDQVSNVIRHGLPDKNMEWLLARREKRGGKPPDPDEIPLTACVECAKPYEKFRAACPHCGAQKPLPEPRSRTLEMVKGDLVLLDRATLEKMRQATVLESAASVADRVAVKAGEFAAKGVANRQIEKIQEHGRLVDAINQWAGVERAKGYSDNEIQRKFYLTLGVDVLTALDASKTRAELEKTRNTIEGWYMK